jgi:hypothetical protein
MANTGVFGIHYRRFAYNFDGLGDLLNLQCLIESGRRVDQQLDFVDSKGTEPRHLNCKRVRGWRDLDELIHALLVCLGRSRKAGRSVGNSHFHCGDHSSFRIDDCST